MMLDAYGKKMSKSVGNIIDPVKVMSEYGADNVRYYMLYASPVWTPLKFDETGLKEIYSKYISTLKNAYSFFSMYANADNIDPRSYFIKESDRELIDRWLLSKLNKLVKEVREAYEEYDLNKVARLIVPFLNDDLSNWYIRINRRRFWDSKLSESKKAVYLTTYEVLVTLCKLCAPITPYITEEIYTKLTNEESVHLTTFPKYNEALIDNSIEEKMDKIRNIISLGRNAREDSKIKVRQPISSCILDGKSKDIIDSNISLIKDELNVKEVIYTDKINDYMNFIIKPNFKVCGKMFGKNIKEFQDLLLNLSDEDKLNLYNGNELEVSFLDNNININITKDMLDIRIEAKEGFNVAMDNIDFIILDTNLTHDLILEGIAREFVSKVQNLRKEKDFDIQDHINIYYSGDEVVIECINKFNEFIKNETLGINIINEVKGKEYDLNNHNTYIDVEKVTE